MKGIKNMENDNLIKAFAIYNGHTIRKNFDVELKLLFVDTQMPNALQFVAGIGRQVMLKAVMGKEKLYIGTFNVNRINIDKNGNTNISLMSNRDYVNLENIEKLMVEEEIKVAGKIVEASE